MAWTNTTRKNSGTGGGVGSINVTLNSTAAGSLIVVGTSWWQGSGNLLTTTVSDGANGAYTQSFLVNSPTSGFKVAATLHYFRNNAGGDLTINVAFASGADSTPDLFAAVHEFAGGDTTAPASGSANSTQGASATASTGSMTPADNDVLLLAMMSEEQGTITENQAGQGFTLSAESESSGQPGSLVFKIISGAPGTPSHTWAKGISGDWAAGIHAFKPAGGAVSLTPTIGAAALTGFAPIDVIGFKLQPSTMTKI